MDKFQVKLSGFHEIDGIERDRITNNCNKFYLKHNKKLKNIEYIEIRLKDYQKQGSRRKFSVNSTLGFSGTVLTSKSFDWSLAKAVDSSLRKIESEITRSFFGHISRKARNRLRRNRKKI